MGHKNTIFILFVLSLPFLLFGCGRTSDPVIEITFISSYEGEAQERRNRGIIIEEVSQSISFSHGSNAVMVYFFSNLSGNESYDYLKEGFVDYIISISRTVQVDFLNTSTLWSKLKLKDITNPDSLSIASVMRIARELNVKYLMTGNFRVIDDDIIISATLRRVEDGLILSESIQRGQFNRLFDIMSKLTMEIFTGIEDHDDSFIRLSDVKQAGIDTESPEAYNHYLHGMYYLKNVQIKEAYNEFAMATQIDPGFGSAFVMLLRVSLTLPGRAYEETSLKKALYNKENFTRINQLLVELFEIIIYDRFANQEKIAYLVEQIDEKNIDHSDPHISFLLLTTFYIYELELDDQIEYLLDILKYNPFFEQAYNFLGYLFARSGDFENAIKYLNQYSILLPESPNPYDSLGDIYRMLGHNDSAKQEYKKALQTDKTFFYSYQNLLTLYEIEYNDQDANNYTNGFFKRFIDQAHFPSDQYTPLTTVFLFFTDKYIEFIDYRVLSSYIIYLIRNGLINNAIDIAERWINNIYGQGDVSSVLKEYPREFALFYFGRAVLINFYLQDNMQGYLSLLESLITFAEPREVLNMNLFLIFYYNDYQWFEEVVKHFDLHEEAEIAFKHDMLKLAGHYNEGEFAQGLALYSNLEDMSIFDMSAFMFMSMQIDIELGDESRISFYSERLKQFRQHFVHLNFYFAMLEELKGNHKQSIKIYEELYNYITANNTGNHKDPVSRILRSKINLPDE